MALMEMHSQFHIVTEAQDLFTAQHRRYVGAAWVSDIIVGL